MKKRLIPFDFSWEFWKRVQMPILQMLGWRNAALDAPFPYDLYAYKVKSYGISWKKAKYHRPTENFDRLGLPFENPLEAGVFVNENGLELQALNVTMYKEI